MPVVDALAAILSGAEPLPEEMVALDAAHHRVLARDVAALRTQPPPARSAVCAAHPPRASAARDGDAVRAADAPRTGVRLRVIGQFASARSFEKAVRPG